jgi:hypothetical protein
VRLEASALVGLYVPAQRAIYVRPHTRSSSAVDPDDVLHELGHALQDDVFGMDGMLAPMDQDEQLAHKAVYEGDATVIAWGIAGQRSGRTAEAAIADRRSLALAQSATLGVAQELQAIPGWSAVPRITQVELFFPYSAGADLVAEAFLAGGPPLVDCVFAHLPTTTEQVLHAAKYFKGEAPIPVRAPAPPAGHELLATGTMGELRTRALLELGLTPDVAVGASVGWGGDAYTVVSNGASGVPAVLWSTVWDTEAHAELFAAAMTREFPPGPSALGPVAIRRDGTRVAWTRGIDDPRALGGLIGLPGTKPPDAPPCGQVILPSSQVARDTLVSAGGDPHITVPALGLQALLPPRFARIRSGDDDLTVQEISQHGRGVVSHDDKPFDPSSFAALTKTVAPVLAVNLPLGKMELLDVALPVGPAKVARWPLADTSGEATFIGVPLCNGTRTLYITTAARTEEARVALAQWVRSIEPIAPGLPAVCSAKGDK